MDDPISSFHYHTFCPRTGIRMKWRPIARCAIAAAGIFWGLNAFGQAPSPIFGQTPPTIRNSSPLVDSREPARVDLKADMIWIEGREITWTLPDAAGNRAAKPDTKRRSPGFSMDRTEVTNRQFAQFLSAADTNASFYDPRMDIVEVSPHQFRPRSGSEDYPVAWVDWYGAFSFSKWAGKALPSEDEWIIAALSGRDLDRFKTAYPWPDSLADSVACNSLKTRDFPTRVAVGSYPAGATSSGLVDLAGNVAEWTTTEFGSTVPGGTPASWTVVKGGSYLDPPVNMSILNRSLRNRSERLSSVGFRCILREPRSH
jgi:formylglycine-generating enzyme required for sulfatase activity